MGVARPPSGRAARLVARASNGGDATRALCGRCRPRARRRGVGSRPERARKRPWPWASSSARTCPCEAEARQGSFAGHARAPSAPRREGSRGKADGRWSTCRAAAGHTPHAHAGRRCSSWAAATCRACAGRTRRWTSRRIGSRTSWRSRTGAGSRRGQGAAHVRRARGPGRASARPGPSAGPGREPCSSNFGGQEEGSGVGAGGHGSEDPRCARRKEGSCWGSACGAGHSHEGDESDEVHEGHEETPSATSACSGSRSKRDEGYRKRSIRRRLQHRCRADDRRRGECPRGRGCGQRCRSSGPPIECSLGLRADLVGKWVDFAWASCCDLLALWPRGSRFGHQLGGHRKPPFKGLEGCRVLLSPERDLVPPVLAGTPASSAAAWTPRRVRGQRRLASRAAGQVTVPSTASGPGSSCLHSRPA